MIKVAVLESEWEAQLLEAVLRDMEIPYLIKSFHDSAYDGLFQSTLGWGSVYALPVYKDEILNYITDIRKS